MRQAIRQAWETTGRQERRRAVNQADGQVVRQ